MATVQKKHVVQSSKSAAKPISKPAVNTYDHSPKADVMIPDSAPVLPGRSNAERNASDAAASRKPTYVERMRKLTPAARAQAKIGNTLLRFSALRDEVTGWSPEITVAADTALAALSTLGHLLVAVPATFAPPASIRARAAKLVAGDAVTIREKRVALYMDVLPDASELEGLTIAKIGESHVTLLSRSGSRIIVPTSHIAAA